MKVGIYINFKYSHLKEAYFNKIYSTLGSSISECRIIENATEVSGLDVLLVLGGDGTILSIAGACAEHSVKILGVNCGHVGFLTDFENDQLDEALLLLKTGNFTTIKRSMLCAEFGGKSYIGLNEAVIQRCTTGNNFTNTVNLHVEIDGSTVDNFMADGLIVSTPTGSTAYSLSAGGSILAPDLNAFILTPICPHSLHSRPIVFSDNSQVTVRQNERLSSLNLVIDGRVVDTAEDNAIFTIKKSRRSLEFIVAENKNFYEKLFIKLTIWSK